MSWQGFKDWVVALFIDEYELTVWYIFKKYDAGNGIKVTERKERVYTLSDISKRTNKHIKGKDVNGARFEIKTVEPFDFQIIKTK